MDFVEFVYASGEPQVVGEGKGEEQEPFDLESGEATIDKAIPSQSVLEK